MVTDGCWVPVARRRVVARLGDLWQPGAGASRGRVKTVGSRHDSSSRAYRVGGVRLLGVGSLFRRQLARSDGCCPGRHQLHRVRRRAARGSLCAAGSTDPSRTRRLLGPCAQGIKDANLPSAGRVISVDVYGQDAMVRLEHDTLFLARFGSGWRVTAAGCTPQEQDRPFSCELKGA